MLSCHGHGLAYWHTGGTAERELFRNTSYASVWCTRHRHEATLRGNMFFFCSATAFRRETRRPAVAASRVCAHTSRHHGTRSRADETFRSVDTRRMHAGTQAALRGCVNDVTSMNTMITTHYGFDPANIKILIDTDPNQESPTGANIKKGLTEIVAAAAPGDILFIHFSGHGTQVRSRPRPHLHLHHPHGKCACMWATRQCMPRNASWPWVWSGTQHAS